MQEKMSSRERMLAAINHEPLDRIPTDIWAIPEVGAALMSHFNCDWEEVNAKLHVDGFAGTGPDFVGPPPPEGSDDYLWGTIHRSVDYGTGTYHEQVGAPFDSAQSIDDLDKFRWPQADWFDFSKVRERAVAGHSQKLVQAGYMAPFFDHNNLRGLEQSFMDPLEDPEFTHEFLRRVMKFRFDYHRRLFEAADGFIDVAQVTDDLGSQTGPLMSLEIYREFYKPYHKQAIELCREFGIRVFHHDDGSCRQFLPDLIELGIEILNPVQWNCPGMDTDGLKRDFGKKICFHGGIENQGILPFGTPEDVRAEVRHCIDSLACDGTGYILAPCHNMQPVTPIENILALYDEAWNYGKLS